MGKIYTFNDKIITINNKWCEEYVEPPAPDPYNPLGLPANTVRVRTSDGEVPKGNYDTATLVSGTSDVYDVYKSGTDFSGMFAKASSNIAEVLGANTAGITNMNTMFQYCNQLTSVATFNTSDVTSMYSMFEQCGSLVTAPAFDTHNVTNFFNMFRMLSSGTASALTAVPLYDTSSAVYVDYMFYRCDSVQSGALALYQQMSQQSSITGSHASTFFHCGSNTTTGAAELAQIPSSWGGTGA